MEGDLILEEERKRANGRDTYFKLYIHSEPGGKTARRESELLLGSGRKVCVENSVDPSSAGTNMLGSAGSCSNSLNMAASAASGAPAALN